MDYFDWAYGIVPFELPAPAPSPSPTPAPSYETPWYVDTINRAIERAAQVATVQVAGYPPMPTFPAPAPSPAPYPLPLPTPQPSGAGIQLSTNTLMILGLIGFAFVFGGRRGR